MAKNRNTFEKRRREMERKRKADEKRERRHARRKRGDEPDEIATTSEQEVEERDLRSESLNE